MIVGRGDVTAWIVQRLRESPKSRYELTLGCRWPGHEVSDALSRLIKRGVVVARDDKEPRGRRGVLCAVYALKTGVQIAESVSRRSGRRVPEAGVRGLEGAWHAIATR